MIDQDGFRVRLKNTWYLLIATKTCLCDSRLNVIWCNLIWYLTFNKCFFISNGKKTLNHLWLPWQQFFPMRFDVKLLSSFRRFPDEVQCGSPDVRRPADADQIRKQPLGRNIRTPDLWTKSEGYYLCNNFFIL